MLSAFQCEKTAIENELNKLLTKDTAGIALSYLHTPSFFKPANPLPLATTANKEITPRV